MNQIRKAASVSGLQPSSEELEQVNQFALRELEAEEVFLFKLAVCDNEIDRDFEAFPAASLYQLAELLTGKTVLLNHNPKAENQVARIYAAAVEPVEGKAASTGEPYARLVAKCYAVRTGGNRDFITEVEAGIKKEVSVGCSVGGAVCSICGQDRHKEYCGHRTGKQYEGKTCYLKLEDPADAYEVSFVAIPAQREAGVSKQCDLPEEQENKQEKAATNLERLRRIFTNRKAEQDEK